MFAEKSFSSILVMPELNMRMNPERLTGNTSSNAQLEHIVEKDRNCTAYGTMSRKWGRRLEYVAKTNTKKKTD